MGIDLPDLAQDTPLWLALLTTGVGALEGAARSRGSIDRDFDLVGAFVCALFLGLGGGLARDVLLGNDPVEAIRTPWYIVVVVGCTAFVLTFRRFIPAPRSVPMLFLDALTLGLYAAIGVQTALSFHVDLVGAVVVGLFASLTGGVIVSLLLQERPALLRPGPPYGLLALAGVVTYVLLSPLGLGLASCACLAVVVLLRWATLRWHVNTHPVGPLQGPESSG